MKNAPDLNSAFTQASEARADAPSTAPQQAPAKEVTRSSAYNKDGTIMTMDMHDMEGTYSVGMDATGGMMVAIATKDRTFLYQPAWEARGSFEAYAYRKDGTGGTAVFPGGSVNGAGDPQAGADYLEAKAKWQRSLKELGPGGGMVAVEGTVSGKEVMDAARAAYDEQQAWKASLTGRPQPVAPAPAPTP